MISDIDDTHPIERQIKIITHEDPMGNISYELVNQDIDIVLGFPPEIPTEDFGYLDQYKIHWQAELIEVRTTNNGWLASYGVWEIGP